MEIYERPRTDEESFPGVSISPVFATEHNLAEMIRSCGPAIGFDIRAVAYDVSASELLATGDEVLVARVAVDPDDAEEWLLVMRVHDDDPVELGEFDTVLDAATALAKALEEIHWQEEQEAENAAGGRANVGER